MAIRINLESQESCWRAYLNYHCYGNSMGITGEEMGAIVNRWGDQIPTWQKNAQTKDEVKYEFDDSEFESYRKEGYNDAKEEHGEDVNLKGAGARAGADWAGAGLSTAAGGAGSLIASLSGKNGSGALTDPLGKIGDGGKGKQGSVGGWVAYILSAVSCIISFAVALNAKKNIANKEEHAAVMSLNEEMANQQTMLNDEVSNMESIREEIVSLEDEAQTANEEANSNIEDKKTDYDMYKRIYETLKAKIESGKPLDETEKKLYQKVVAILGTTSTAITDEVDNASSVVNDIYGDIESFSADYDIVAETIANVQGVTDYAAEIDEKTQKLCNSEKTAQMVNTIGAGLAAAGMVTATVMLATQYAAVWPVALAISIGGAAFTALAVMAGIWSGKAAAQQGKMSEEVGVEIAARQTTQDMGTETLDIYGEELDAYDGSLDNLSEFEVLVPDDTAAPEGAPAVPTSAPPATQTPNNEGSQNGDGADNGTKKKSGTNGANA